MAPAVSEQLSFTSNKKSSSVSRTAQLADFCSFVVPCIWYGSASPANRRHSAPDVTKSYSSFRKFCYDILNATQISSSCILLSLKYIQNLKRQNPNIRGAEGSEYRLFTVALMLANKYLDDNTYTNKTWAEVSNLPVQELNIMEIEYLSALDYSLFVSEQEYLHWLKECETYVARQGQYMQQYANAMLRPTKIPTGVRRTSPPPQVPSRNLPLPSINMSKFMPTPLATNVQKRGFSDTGYQRPVKRVNVYGVQSQNTAVLPTTPPHYGERYTVPLITPIPTYPQMPISPAYTPPSSQQYYSAPVTSFTSVPSYMSFNTSTLTMATPVPLYPATVMAPLVDRTNLQHYRSNNIRRASYQQVPFGNSNMPFSSDFTFQSATVM